MRRFAISQSIRAVLGGLAIWAVAQTAVLAVGGVPEARGQGFDPEREALDARSRIEFSYSSLGADSSTEVGGERADQTSSRHNGAGAFAGWAAGPVFAGGGGDQSLFREKTPDFEVRVRREAAGASGALRLGPLLAVASSGYAVFDSTIKNPGTAFIDFKVTQIADRALALYLDMGPLRLGYSHAWERLKLDFDETGQSSYRERYAFERGTWHASVELAEGQGLQLSAGVRRSSSPARQGADIDYGGSDESTDFGSIGYGFSADDRVYLSLSHGQSQVRFDDLLDIERDERTASAGVELDSGLFLSLSQSERSDTQTFAPAMGLQKVRSNTTTLSASAGWRF